MNPTTERPRPTLRCGLLTAFFVLLVEGFQNSYCAPCYCVKSSQLSYSLRAGSFAYVYLSNIKPFQESYFTYPPQPESPVNHDILFRAGVAPDGSDTFTPRTLIYDLKGGFGNMKKISALYETEDDINLEFSGTW